MSHKNFSIALKLHDKNADFYYERGCCNNKLGNHIEAVNDFSYSLLLHPELTNVRRKKQKKDDSLGIFEKSKGLC